MKQTEQTFLLRDKQIARNAIEAIKSLYGDKTELETVMEVVIREHKKDRSLAQNRLSHRWYGERAEQQGTTPEHEHSSAKLRYGCPILIASDADFAEVYRRAIEPLDYERRLIAMRYFPVTRLMTVAQMTKYLETIERESAMQGIVLSKPVAIYEEAMGR